MAKQIKFTPTDNSISKLATFDSFFNQIGIDTSEITLGEATSLMIDLEVDINRHIKELNRKRKEREE